MSWFARSIANTLQLGDDDDEDDEQHRLNNNTDKDASADQQDEQQVQEEDSPLSPGRGVKEDLSEITKTLTSRFWGVASFLAPPPTGEQSNEQSDPSDPEDGAPEAISGIRRDFAEIGGRFRSGISKLSTNMDVSEITKMASNFLQLSPEDDDYVTSRGVDAIGVTDEVVAFVRDITMHPETWLDFPLPEDEDDGEDFELSDAQQEHALAVESLAPRLAALRIELCPGYMSESTFWKIYFVLLHPRLEPHAAELLSTPEIVKARAALMHDFKKRSNAQPKQSEEARNNSSYSEPQEDHFPVPSRTQSESMPLDTSNKSTVSADAETEKHPIPNEEIQIIDKSVIQEDPQNEPKPEDQNTHSNVLEDDADDWLKEEDSLENVTGTTTTIPIENDEDVTFSDLEEDDADDGPANYKKVTYGSDLSTKDSRDWVQLGTGTGQVSGRNNSEMKESNDWLDVDDDIDVA